MSKLFSFLLAAAVVVLVIAVFALLTFSGGGVMRQVDAISVDQFLQNKQALYEALNARMLSPPAGATLTEPYQSAALTPKFMLSWPPEDIIRIGSTGQYTYETKAEFVLDLEHSALPLDRPGYDLGAAKALLDYYFEPLVAQGFERNGGGGTMGKTMLVSEHWNRRFDPTINVIVDVFVAPASKEAVVTIEIRERLAK